MRSLIPWKWREAQSAPDNALTEFRRDVDDLFSNFFGNKGWLPGTAFGQGFTPAFDVSETEEDLIVKAELPGVDPNAIEVNLTGNTLTVKGEKKEKREEKTKRICTELRGLLVVSHVQ
jgi:HSP20 family protein